MRVSAKLKQFVFWIHFYFFYCADYLYDLQISPGKLNWLQC